MDVRAADTTDLAAKRLDMDNVKAIHERRGYQDGQMTSQAVEKIGERGKGSRQNREEQADEYVGSGLPEEPAPVAGQVAPIPPAPISDEERRLDVKV